MNFFSKKHKIIIQVLLSLILFIFGMYYTPMEADSLLTFETTKVTTSNFTQIKNINQNLDLCTAEMLGQQSTFRTSLPCSYSSYSNTKILLKYFFYFFIPCIQIAIRSFSLLFFLAIPKLLLKIFSLDNIISYIHNKDGKKSPLFQL